MGVAVDDIIRITAVMQFDGLDDMVNVFHFKLTSVSTSNDDEFMADMASVMDDLYTEVVLAFSELVVFIDVQGQNVTQNELLPSKPWPVLVNGGSMSTPLPSQVAACVYHGTLRPKTRASKFLPVFTEGQNDGNGKIGDATQVLIQAFGDFLVGAIVGSAFTALYGAYNKGFDRFTVAGNAIVPTRWRTQRRRRLGVGS